LEKPLFGSYIQGWKLSGTHLLRLGCEGVGHSEHIARHSGPFYALFTALFIYNDGLFKKNAVVIAGGIRRLSASSGADG
jgi:hypothetical protein